MPPISGGEGQRAAGRDGRVINLEDSNDSGGTGSKGQRQPDPNDKQAWDARGERFLNKTGPVKLPSVAGSVHFCGRLLMRQSRVERFVLLLNVNNPFIFQIQSFRLSFLPLRLPGWWKDG